MNQWTDIDLVNVLNGTSDATRGTPAGKGKHQLNRANAVILFIIGIQP